MRRSSGTYPTPTRLISWVGRRVISRPSKRMAPPVTSTRPTMALSVVDLPAPLRPSSETTSPARAESVTPWSTRERP